MKSFGGHDFSFGVLRKVILEWLAGGEGSPEYPWQADNEDLGPLVLPPGVLWLDGNFGTLRWTYQPYELGAGLAGDANGHDGTFETARWYRLFVESDGSPFTIVHPLGHFPPFIQFTQKLGASTYLLFDIFGAGGTVQFDNDGESIHIDPGGSPVDLFVILSA